MYKKWNTEEERKASRHAAQVRYYIKHRKRVNKRAREAAKEKYDRDQPAARIRINAYRLKIRLEVLAGYGGKCVCCGEDHPHFLALDHINGTTEANRKVERKSGIGWHLKLRREGYPDHIQVLCHNCNSAKGFYGVCPHQQ